MYCPHPGEDSFAGGMEAVGRRGDAAVDRGRLPEPSPSSAVAVVAIGGTSSASEYCFELLDSQRPHTPPKTILGPLDMSVKDPTEADCEREL